MFPLLLALHILSTTIVHASGRAQVPELAALMAMACLVEPHLLLVAAQVPTIEELSSTWQLVRICRPAATKLLPCPAGVGLDAQACADYGCCHDRQSAQCFLPNGEDRLAAGGPQEVFAANQAVPAIAQPGGALAVDNGGDLLGVGCFDAPPFAGTCGPESFGTLSIDGFHSAALTTGLSTLWAPHHIMRNATLWRPGGGEVRGMSSVRMGFDSQVVLLRLELEALSPSQAPLNVSISLAALIFAQTGGWAWPIERPRDGDGMVCSVRRNTPGALTVHPGSNTSSVSAFSQGTPVPVLSMQKSAAVVASWPALQMKPGEPIIIELALAVGRGDPVDIEQKVDAVAQDFGSAWADAATDWSDWWDSAFDPSMHAARQQAGRRDLGAAVVFEGQLPILTSDDEALKRTYYMGAVTLLTMARHDIVSGSKWEGKMCFGSAGVESAFAAMYIWDTTLNSLLLTLLEPSYFQSMIEAWLGMGIHQHYAVDYVSNKGIGPW
eukprot:COSAG02_NODE_1027_length_15115_cov_118.186867_8_plen_495_part_00